VNSWRSVSSRWTCCRRSNSVHRFGLRSIVPKSKRSRSWRSGVLPPKHSPARMLQYSRYDRSCRAASRRRGRRASVGFRPFVHRLAGRYGLAGWVRNTGSGVEALIEGDGEQIDEFLNALIANRRRSRTYRAARGRAPVDRREQVTIVASETTAERRRFRPTWRYAATAGASYTIPPTAAIATPSSTAPTAVRAIRSSRACPTTANARRCAGLPCARRAGVNTKIRSRRFHAEPIACPNCGARLKIVETQRGGARRPCLAARAGSWAKGKIVALKSIGGYHLACDAYDDGAVKRLRAWKEARR